MIKKTLLSVLFLAFVAVLMPKSTFAATLQFDPTSLTCAVGGKCEVDVVVDAGTDEILATDARITYDKSILSVDGITDGTFLTIGKKDFSKDGEIYVAGLVDDPANSKTGSGVLATITFRGKTNGSATLAFFCKPGETATDSNIAKNDLNATDIIQCANNRSSAVKVGVGTGTTGTGTTGTGSTTGSSTGTGGSSTPSQLPKSGIMDELFKWAVPGTILLLVGTGMLLL